MANELIQVPFHGDVIEATQDEQGEVWVSLRRVCESLGLDPTGQVQRLKRQPWANTCMMHVLDSAGRNFEQTGIHLRSLPMWLATVEAKRVREEVRPKLILFQSELAEVVADYVLGTQTRRQLPAALDPAPITVPVQAPPALLAPMVQILERFDRLLERMENQPSPVRDLVTVDDRCRQLWPQATRKNMHRVRDIAVGLLLQKKGKLPYKLVPHKNGNLAFEREDLAILDEAIDRAKEELRKANGEGPLFT